MSTNTSTNFTLPNELLPLLLTFTTFPAAANLRRTCRRLYFNISHDDLAYPYAKCFIANRPLAWGGWNAENTIKWLSENDIPMALIAKSMQIIMGWKMNEIKLWTYWSIEEFLVAAVKHFPISAVEFALKHNAKIHHDHSLPICLASSRGDLPILTLLINHGADPNANSTIKTPHPLKHRSYDLVNTPLVRACTANHIHIMHYLLQKGADISVDDFAVAKAAVKIDSSEILHLLIGNGLNPHFDSNRLLFTAVIHSHPNIARYLLRTCGADPNDRDGALLYQACVKGHLGIVRELLECGADVNRPYRGGLPIMVAWNLDVVKILVKFGADVDKGLEHACALGLVDVAEFLVLNGANPAVSESFPLRIAAKNGATEFLRMLILKGGLDVHACEDEAIKNAAVVGHAECVDLLLRNGKFDTDVLSWAAYGAGMGGHLHILKMLPAHGADLHFNDEILLREAVTAGYLKVVEYLLQLGANPQYRPKHVEKEKAWTALEEAVLRGEVQMVRMVVEVGKCWENGVALEKAYQLGKRLGASLQLMAVLEEARKRVGNCT